MKSGLAAERRFARLFGRFREFFVVGAGFGCADGGEKLSAGGRGAGEDIQIAMAPVRRHLASAGSRVVLGADALKKHFEGVTPSMSIKARSR